MVSIPGFCGIEKELRFNSNERDTEIVEERNHFQAPIDVGINKNEICSNRAGRSILSVVCRCMTTKRILRRCVDTEKEVVLKGKKSARSPSLDRPIEIHARVFGHRQSVVQFSNAARVVRISEK